MKLNVLQTYWPHTFCFKEYVVWRCSFPRFSVSTWAFQWSSSKEIACSVTDAGSIPGSGRSPGGWHGTPLQYSCPVNPMDRGAWRAIVHGVTKSWTQLSNWAHTHRHPHHGKRAGVLMPRAEGFQLRALTTLLKGSVSLMHLASLKDWQVSESIWFQAGWYNVTYHHTMYVIIDINDILWLLHQSCFSFDNTIKVSTFGRTF